MKSILRRHILINYLRAIVKHPDFSSGHRLRSGIGQFYALRVHFQSGIDVRKTLSFEAEAIRGGKLVA